MYSFFSTPPSGIVAIIIRVVCTVVVRIILVVVRIIRIIVLAVVGCILLGAPAVVEGFLILVTGTSSSSGSGLTSFFGRRLRGLPVWKRA